MPKHDRDLPPAGAPHGSAAPRYRPSLVDEASDGSFPASDPPPYGLIRVGTPDNAPETDDVPPSRLDRPAGR